MRKHHHVHRSLPSWFGRTCRNRASTAQPEELPHLPMRNPRWHHPPARCCTWCSDGGPHQTSRHRRNRSIHHTKIKNIRRAATRTHPNQGHHLYLDRMPHSFRPMPSRSHHTMAPHPKHLRRQRCTPLRQTQPPQRTRLAHLERHPRQLAHPTTRRHHHHTRRLTDPLRATYTVGAARRASPLRPVPRQDGSRPGQRTTPVWVDSHNNAGLSPCQRTANETEPCVRGAWCTSNG
jgi:hypothetical protein